jgi:hypothetical protein
MRLHHAIPLVLSFLPISPVAASEVSWMFCPGYYTHSPITGKRVAQYEPDSPSYVTVDPTYQESGYRHELIQAGNDIVNIVQTWGAGTAIRPYGEWEYPYRAGATPYGPWGNPQGPWTLPFDAWRNPYGLNRPPYYGYGQPGYGNGRPVAQPMPQPTPSPIVMPGSALAPGAASVPPPPGPPGPPGPPAPQGQSL